MFIADYKWPATGLTAPTSLPSGCKMVVDLTATEDLDSTVTIPHLMERAPLEVYLTPILGPVFTALSAWTIASINETSVIVKKASAVNSGQPVAQVRLIIGLPHSLEL